MVSPVPAAVVLHLAKAWALDALFSQKEKLIPRSETASIPAKRTRTMNSSLLLLATMEQGPQVATIP